MHEITLAAYFDEMAKIAFSDDPAVLKQKILKLQALAKDPAATPAEKALATKRMVEHQNHLKKLRGQAWRAGAPSLPPPTGGATPPPRSARPGAAMVLFKPPAAPPPPPMDFSRRQSWTKGTGGPFSHSVAKSQALVKVPKVSKLPALLSKVPKVGLGGKILGAAGGLLMAHQLYDSTVGATGRNYKRLTGPAKAIASSPRYY